MHEVLWCDLNKNFSASVDRIGWFIALRGDLGRSGSDGLESPDPQSELPRSSRSSHDRWLSWHRYRLGTGSCLEERLGLRLTAICRLKCDCAVIQLAGGLEPKVRCNFFRNPVR